jgi:hypothetical protein
MSDEIITKRKQTFKEKNKATEPVWKMWLRQIVRMAIQTIVFYLFFYSLFIDGVRGAGSNPFASFAMELWAIINWLIASDFIALGIMYIAKIIYYYFGGYTKTRVKNRNYGKLIWQYVLYVFFRALFYTMQLMNFIMNLLEGLGAMEFIAFFIAWTISSLGAILLSRAGAVWIVSQG